MSAYADRAITAVDSGRAAIVHAANVRVPLEVREWEGAVRELAELLSANEGGFDVSRVVEACLYSSPKTPGDIAPYVAIAGARVEDIDRPLIAVGIAPGDIALPAQGGAVVDAVIVLLTPRALPDAHLRTMTALMRALGRRGARERLVCCVTPEEVSRFFADAGCELPDSLVARDVMNAAPVTVLESDELRVVIDALCARGLLDVTVVDEEGDLRGVVSLEDVLRLGLPDHLLWMHDVSPILHFEPFAELLQRDRERKAADVMREHMLTVPDDTPAIEVAKRFLTEGARQIWVVEGRKLLGVIELRDFMARLLWQ